MAKIQDIRNRTQRTNGTRSVSQIKYIIRHHSATDTGNFDSFWSFWKSVRGWGTGGYHEIILRDGTVQLCYDPHEITNGVGNFNTPTYHICLVGNGSFTAAQEKAWDERVKYNMARLGIGVNNVRGHREMPGANTTCPGINMDVVRSRIKGTSIYTPPKKQTGSVTITKPSPKGVVWVGTNDKGKRVESIYKGSDRLNFYDGPRWTNPNGTFGYGEGWIVDNLYRVDGALMYRVQNSKGKLYYITASSKYVKVVGGTAKAKSKPKKSISQMADEVIAGKHGNGNETRRKSLGISKAEYEKVRAEVNRRL